MDHVLKKERDSNLELFRIVTMIFIVAHHYVVNSGLLDADGPILTNYFSFKSLLLLIFGAWGKIGINCFVLITGYFMCKSNASVRKFVKLLCEVWFYNITIALIFILVGYEKLTLSRLFDILFPISEITQGFTPCFLFFYLLIPFLKILVSHLSEKQHFWLLVLSLAVFTVFGTIPLFEIEFNYVTWFVVLFFVSSYVRLYDKPVFANEKLWFILSMLSILLSVMSVVACTYIGNQMGLYVHYYFISDSNKILAVVTSFSLFMFFKNLHIKRSKIINTISMSSFGVLLIHANCESMRTWLWKDTLNVVDMYYSNNMILVSILLVITVYVVCSLIDMLRIQLLEKPFLKYWDNHFSNISNFCNRVEKRYFQRLSDSEV